MSDDRNVGSQVREEPQAAPQPLVERVVAFGRLLRARGVRLTQAETQDALRALTMIQVGEREEFRAALRATLVHRFEDLATFDLAFEQFWRLPLPGEEGCDLPESDGGPSGGDSEEQREGAPEGPENQNEPNREAEARVVEALLAEEAEEGDEEERGADAGGASY